MSLYYQLFPLVCSEPIALGMKSGLILDSQITASSDAGINDLPRFARLSSNDKVRTVYGWAPASHDVKTSWLKVDFQVIPHMLCLFAFQKNADLTFE